MRSIVTHAAGEYSHKAAVLISDWGAGPSTVDLGTSTSARVVLVGTVIDGGAASVVIRAGDSPDPAQNGVEATFTVPAGTNVNSPVHLDADLEVIGRYVTLDPGAASLTGVAFLDAFPV